jgi:hypothetical protein
VPEFAAPLAVVRRDAPPPDARPVAGPRQLSAWYAAFAAFAGLVFAISGKPAEWAWGACAAVGYAIAALVTMMSWPRSREAALAASLAGAIATPLAWQATSGRMLSSPDQAALRVVARAAVLLLRHGTPYLPAAQITHALGYNPYEPAMTLFGLPAAAGLQGAVGNPRLWMAVTTVAVLAGAFRLAEPGRALRRTAFVMGSPVLALPLTAGLTDPPVIALLCLTLAWVATRPPVPRARLAAAIALGAACAIKVTALPALPVIAALLAVRDGPRAAARFVISALLTTGTLIVATAPASLTRPAALFQNTVLFPLGLTRYQTQAASPLPGHLLASTGSAGRWAAIALMAVACLVALVSLVVRPPADIMAAAGRLAVWFAVLFALAPASRWGYFAYPAAVLGFVGIIPGWRPARRYRAAPETVPMTRGEQLCGAGAELSTVNQGS